jgi:hypothetical protein
MYKRILGTLAILFAGLCVFAQDSPTGQGIPVGQEGPKVLYRNEMSGGLVAHTAGLGVNFRRGKHVTGMRKRVFELEFVNMRHAKEIKTVNPYFENSKGFYYGKLHTFHVLRGGLGYQNVIYSKADGRGVEIRYVTFLGASLGLAKPVYLEILHGTVIPFEFNLTTERYDPEKHFVDNIYGRAPYFRGVDEMKVFPGGYAKLGLSFEYAPYEEDVKAIETGISIDVYPKVVPIMAHDRNNQAFVQLYINLLYGRKWY